MKEEMDCHMKLKFYANNLTAVRTNMHYSQCFVQLQQFKNIRF